MATTTQSNVLVQIDTPTTTTTTLDRYRLTELGSCIPFCIDEIPAGNSTCKTSLITSWDYGIPGEPCFHSILRRCIIPHYETGNTLCMSEIKVELHEMIRQFTTKMEQIQCDLDQSAESRDYDTNNVSSCIKNCEDIVDRLTEILNSMIFLGVVEMIHK